MLDDSVRLSDLEHSALEGYVRSAVGADAVEDTEVLTLALRGTERVAYVFDPAVAQVGALRLGSSSKHRERECVCVFVCQ